MPRFDGTPPPPDVAAQWSVFVFATMVYDAAHARMHAMVESCAPLGFEAVYVEFPNSRSIYHPDAGAPTLNRGGLHLAPPAHTTRAANGTDVLCVPKKLGIGPARLSLGRRNLERLQGAWLERFFAEYRQQTGKRVLAIVSTARWEPLVRDIPFDLVVFDKLDPPETLTGWLSLDEYVAREDALIRRSALVPAITQGLVRDVAARHPNARTMLLPNGVDSAFFAAHRDDPVPELEHAARPIAGFLGTVAPWVDIPLLAECARAYPDWTFPVIGPVAGSVDVAPLQALPNVRLLGAVPYERVPALMNAFDVGLMPFRPGVVSDLSSPVTLYEYLALGKPLVCTPLSDMDDLDDLLYMGRESYVANLARAADEGGTDLPERRVDAAKSFSWDALVGSLLTRLPLAPAQVTP